MSSDIDLGFAEKVDPIKNQLKSKFFPSKVGGKPCWLALNGLPRPDELRCAPCDKQLMFLLQIYAPLESLPRAFHRTLFVFCCVNCSKTFKTFRCQLARENEFYSPDPPNYDDLPDSEENTDGVEKLCSVCGCFADKSCSKCKSVNYCSREHQMVDWKLNDHKSSCGKDATSHKAGNMLLPEYDIAIEPEEPESSEEEDEDDEDETDQMKEYLKYINRLKPVCQNENIEKEMKEDASLELFCKFRSKIKNAPEQIIRYYQFSDKKPEPEPLWINEKYPVEAPKCSTCGRARRLEFQIMPALLNYFTDSNLDFGTLTVYCCTGSCDIQNSRYGEEYIWLQNVDN